MATFSALVTFHRVADDTLTTTTIFDDGVAGSSLARDAAKKFKQRSVHFSLKQSDAASQSKLKRAKGLAKAVVVLNDCVSLDKARLHKIPMLVSDDEHAESPLLWLRIRAELVKRDARRRWTGAVARIGSAPSTVGGGSGIGGGSSMNGGGSPIAGGSSTYDDHLSAGGASALRPKKKGHTLSSVATRSVSSLSSRRFGSSRRGSVAGDVPSRSNLSVVKAPSSKLGKGGRPRRYSVAVEGTEVASSVLDSDSSGAESGGNRKRGKRRSASDDDDNDDDGGNGDNDSDNSSRSASSCSGNDSYASDASYSDDASDGGGSDDSDDSDGGDSDDDYDDDEGTSRAAYRQRVRKMRRELAIAGEDIEMLRAQMRTRDEEVAARTQEINEQTIRMRKRDYEFNHQAIELQRLQQEIGELRAYRDHAVEQSDLGERVRRLEQGVAEHVDVLRERNAAIAKLERETLLAAETHERIMHAHEQELRNTIEMRDASSSSKSRFSLYAWLSRGDTSLVQLSLFVVVVFIVLFVQT
jgi:hypothetical protein